MVDYAESSQLNLWLFESADELQLCRSKANLEARQYICSLRKKELELDLNDSSNGIQTTSEVPSAPAASTSTANKSHSSAAIPVEHFACRFSKSRDPEVDQNNPDRYSQGPWECPSTDDKLHPFLSVEEEQVLVSFYVSKLPSLIGPLAQLPRLRRESKVTATAALLTRRFFLSNSVMLHDPKTILVAAAFLGSKVEDAMADVRSLEEGTALMNAPVKKDEIIPAEIALLTGANFDLLCFHPYKSVLAITEDLRTYLKSEQGQRLVTLASRDGNTDASKQSNAVVSGQDLKPMYDAARLLLDDVVLSDLPLLFNPGQIGFAALMVAQDQVLQLDPALPRIDLPGYIRQRFDDNTSTDLDWLESTLPSICQMLRELNQGMWGCGKYQLDMSKLKSIHKKLKKVRAWGAKDISKKRNRDNAKSPATEAKASRKKQKT